jgi:single-strand DNA-binding protein
VVVIDGYLGKDPELRHSNSGCAFLSFSVAVKAWRKSKEGGGQEVTSWIDCQAIGKRAESLGNVLHKGLFVVISGELQQETWEKEGRRQSRLRVIVNNLSLGPRSDGPRSRVDSQSQTIDDDQIPF